MDFAGQGYRKGLDAPSGSPYLASAWALAYAGVLMASIPVTAYWTILGGLWAYPEGMDDEPDIRTPEG